VLNKTAGSTFTIDDERLLLSVGLKLAIFMENAMLWQQLQVHIAELKRSNDDLKQFAYVCSHDLQEPLRTISNYTQLLAKRYKGVLNDDADQFIDFIVDGAKRMQQQIEDLLLYSRVDRKGESFAHADCGEIVAAAIANLSLSIEETRAEIQVGQLPALFCDKSQIQQLIQNLLSNAMKFRSEQTPVVKINSADAGSNWTFTVEDNGIGFDMKHADRVFVIFKRLQTKDNYPGTGIGLAICKKIVERHGGRIWAESVPGNGSSFHFSIPKAAANE